MNATKSLLSLMTLSLVLSTSARAEEILPPYGHEIQPAQVAAGSLAVATSDLMKETNLFIRKNQLGNPQNSATIHPYYRAAYEDVRVMQANARAVQTTLGTAESLNAYLSLKQTFLNLNNSIRAMKNSGLKNSLEVGREFDNVRNQFENVRGFFITRWKNKAAVDSGAANAIQSARYSIERLQALVESDVGPNVPGNGRERTRAVIAQIRVIIDDVQLFQAHVAQSLRDPRTQGLQATLAEIRTSVSLLQQLSGRWSVRPEAQAEANAVSAAVGNLDAAYTAELQ